MALDMARKCVPYTPFGGVLATTRVALVTSAGVHLRSQQPFNLDGDESYRVIAGDVAAADLMVTHPTYDHRDADHDINCIFPIDRLRDLVAEGYIGGIANKHIGYMGYSMKLKTVYDETVPAIANEVERSNAGAVLLTGGCPHVCHRTIVAIQRGIEMRGIPTVLVTVRPTESVTMRPPRAIYPVGFAVGNSFGGPGQTDLQNRVARAALLALTRLAMPGTIEELPFAGYQPGAGGVANMDALAHEQE